MRSESDRPPEICNCLALRQAARHVTQFYDQCMAPTGLRTSQYSVLAKLNRLGPMTINALAELLVMDRTTLGRNVMPLERDGLIALVRGPSDRRSKELHLTKAGKARLPAARAAWTRAQARFDAVFGGGRAADLRALMHDVAASALDPAPGSRSP